MRVKQHGNGVWRTFNFEQNNHQKTPQNFIAVTNLVYKEVFFFNSALNRYRFTFFATISGNWIKFLNQKVRTLDVVYQVSRQENCKAYISACTSFLFHLVDGKKPRQRQVSRYTTLPFKCPMYFKVCAYLTFEALMTRLYLKPMLLITPSNQFQGFLWKWSSARDLQYNVHALKPLNCPHGCHSLGQGYVNPLFGVTKSAQVKQTNERSASTQNFTFFINVRTKRKTLHVLDLQPSALFRASKAEAQIITYIVKITK